MANLIQNGSFEQGSNPGAYLPLQPGSTAITGWTVIASPAVPASVQGGIDYYATGWVSEDGNRSLDLNGTPGVGGIQQTFATTPGQTYEVSFYMAGHPSGLLQTMEVSAAGQHKDFTFQSGTDPNHLGWQKDTWDFTANTPQTTLQFYSLQTGYRYGGPALDNVAVVPGSITPGFNGDRVSLQVLYQPNANSSPVVSASHTATVVPGVTTFPDVAAYSTGAAAAFNNRVVHASVTFYSHELTISYPTSEEGTFFTTGTFNGYDIQTAPTDPPITGVSLAYTNIQGLSASDLAYSAHEIRVNVAGLTLPTNAPGEIELSDPPTGTAAATVSSTTTSLPTTMSFISENGSNQTISAHTSAETLLGSSQYGDTFQGTSANLNGDLIKFFGGNDSIDVTDLTFARATLSYGGDSKSGMLSLSDGVHNAHIRLTGDFSQAEFQLASDMHGGTSVTYT